MYNNALQTLLMNRLLELITETNNNHICKSFSSYWETKCQDKEKMKEQAKIPHLGGKLKAKH